VFAHACKMSLEGIVSKRKTSIYRSGPSRDWLKFKNPAAPAVKRDTEEDWGKRQLTEIKTGLPPATTTHEDASCSDCSLPTSSS
jgi:hypothetical protein